MTSLISTSLSSLESDHVPHLEKPFRDTWWICPGGLQTNMGYIFEFYKIMYLCLDEVGVITPSVGPLSMVLQI